jgi:Ser/Thr protein kinase RdoA (MazF antagonist)
MPLLPRPGFYFQKLRSLLQFDRQHPIGLTNVLDVYDFHLIDYIFKPAGGNRGINIILKTSKGKKLLKIYRTSLGKSTIIQEHSILNYLEKIGFPAPRLFPTKTGDTLLKCDENFFAIFDFIEGGFQYKNFYFFPKQAKDLINTAGKTLGNLHKKMSDFRPEGYNPDGFKSKVEDRWRNLKWFDKKFRYFNKKSSDFETSDEKYKLRLIRQKTEYLKEELNRLDGLLLKSNLFRLVIHGDYGPYNLLFRKDAPIVVLDFEMARLDWRLDDIIHAWHRFCYNRCGYNFKKMRLFFNAYQIHMPLYPEEIKLIPEVWKHINIRGLIRNLYNYCTTDKKFSLKAAIKSLDSVDWIEAHKDVFLRFICS